MRARIEFKYMIFSKRSEEFKLIYKIEEFNLYKLNWEESINFKLPNFSKSKEYLFWLKNNLYEVYKMLDLEIPFEVIDWIFKKRPKSMGIDLYE